MADTITTNFGWVKPEVGGSPDTWGAKMNANLDGIDAQIATRLLRDGSNVSNAATFRTNIGMATISQAEAEAGTATTVRAVTAQRMRQAVAAYAAPISHTHTAAQITGTFPESQIPNLNASKVTGGTFADARIPNLNTSKFTAGTLPVARGGTGETSVAAYRAVYTGTANGNTSFAIGAYLGVSYNEPRNATIVVRLNTSDTTSYTASGSGTALSGTWRARGGTTQGLAQRVA